MSAMPIRVTRTYLELRSPDELHPAPLPDAAPRLERMGECPASFYRYLYAETGRAFHWVDRLSWTDDQIRRHLSRPGLSLWLLTWEAAPAGWFELARHDDGSVEIAYFGLLPDYIGRGWGKHLLTQAVRAAWAERPTRVWLHTCTLDHPAALPNYLARGFRVVKKEEYVVESRQSSVVSRQGSPRNSTDD
jgi:ribosomal protein S18 acetylase RimI-like enzyme